MRIFVNENTEVAYNLRQEFVRIRNNREGDREAIVAGMCQLCEKCYILPREEAKGKINAFGMGVGGGGGTG